MDKPDITKIPKNRTLISIRSMLKREMYQLAFNNGLRNPFKEFPSHYILSAGKMISPHRIQYAIYTRLNHKIKIHYTKPDNAACVEYEILPNDKDALLNFMIKYNSDHEKYQKMIELTKMMLSDRIPDWEPRYIRWGYGYDDSPIKGIMEFVSIESLGAI